MVNLHLWADCSNVLGAEISDLKASALTTSLFLWGEKGAIKAILLFRGGGGVIFVQSFQVTKL